MKKRHLITLTDEQEAAARKAMKETLQTSLSGLLVHLVLTR